MRRRVSDERLEGARTERWPTRTRGGLQDVMRYEQRATTRENHQPTCEGRSRSFAPSYSATAKRSRTTSTGRERIATRVKEALGYERALMKRPAC